VRSSFVFRRGSKARNFRCSSSSGRRRMDRHLSERSRIPAPARFDSGRHCRDETDLSKLKRIHLLYLFDNLNLLWEIEYNFQNKGMVQITIKFKVSALNIIKTFLNKFQHSLVSYTVSLFQKISYNPETTNDSKPTSCSNQIERKLGSSVLLIDLMTSFLF